MTRPLKNTNYHFVFQITSIDCSVRKVTRHQLSHWAAGKLQPVTPQGARTMVGGVLRHIVFIQYNWGGDTISTRCVFNRPGVTVNRDGKRKQHERNDYKRGLIISQDAPRNLLIPICLKLAWIKPSLCLQVLCQRFQYFVHFLWVTEEKMFSRRNQEK